MCPNPDNNPGNSEHPIEMMMGPNGKPVSRGEVTDQLLGTDDQIIDKWLASIGLTRKDVVDLAATRYENTKFVAGHMTHGKTTPEDHLADQEISDAIAKEKEKLGLEPKREARH